MKSRIIKTVPETIIAYKQRENLAFLKRIAASLKISLTVAEDNLAGESVGFLAGYGGFASNGSSEEAEEGCLIFANLSSSNVDKVLSALREAKISIPYKAVVTASNQSWSLKKLISELAAERSRLGG